MLYSIIKFEQILLIRLIIIILKELRKNSQVITQFLEFNYDWYDNNILHAFQMHSILPLENDFPAIKLDSRQVEYV